MAKAKKQPIIFKQSNTSPLLNISENGKPPQTRLRDAEAARELAQKLIQDDAPQEEADANVYGLIMGRPPFSKAKLREAGQSWRSDFNSRIGKSYLSTALTQVWDVIASAHPKCQVQLDVGDPEKRVEWSKVVTEEFDLLNEKDRDLNYMFQLSQWNTVLYGYGPVMWMDKTDYRAKPIPKFNLHVPKKTKSNVSEWPCAVVQVPYQVNDLYAYIRNAESAGKRGWKVEQVQKSIIGAMPQTLTNQLGKGWMAYEQAIQHNDLWFGSVAEEVMVDWVFVKEFDGRITRCAIDHKDGDWLYQSIGEYESWHQAIAPMYYDQGDGEHYGVKGLGVECYDMLSTYDRLENHTVDCAFIGSSLHMQSTGGSALEEQSIIPMGGIVYHPPGFQLLPTTQMGPALQAAVVIKQDLLNTLTTNLAQYRPENRKQGNPVTAREIDFQSENLNTLGRSQITRYWDQLTDFWAERYRRASNTGLTKDVPGGTEALEFQERCVKRGVPKESLKGAIVRATQSIGFGNSDARRQTLERMVMRLPLYNETGRQNIIEDITAADVGYTNSLRYCPPNGELGPDEKEQQREATQDITGMKNGQTPVITPKSNPYICATTYLLAVSQAAQSVTQGGPIDQAYNFLKIAIPATEMQIQRMAGDPTRKQVVAQMEAQLKQATQIFRKLEAQLQQQMAARQQQQARAAQMQQQMTVDQMIKSRESQMNMARKDQEAQHRMQLKSEQTAQKLEQSQEMAAQKRVAAEQDLQIKDLTSAANIQLKKREQESKPTPNGKGNK